MIKVEDEFTSSYYSSLIECENAVFLKII